MLATDGELFRTERLLVRHVSHFIYEWPHGCGLSNVDRD